MVFRYGNFTLKSARGLIFGGEKISIPETLPIRKSYIFEDPKLELHNNSPMPHGVKQGLQCGVVDNFWLNLLGSYFVTYELRRLFVTKNR